MIIGMVCLNNDRNPPIRELGAVLHPSELVLGSEGWAGLAAPFSFLRLISDLCRCVSVPVL